MANANNEFDRNVFINCPFDSAYQCLIRPLLFTIVYCGLKPRIASERADSGEVRVSKIIELLRESKYSVHDLSRMDPTADTLPRLNMPFELGLDIGMRIAGKGRLSQKKILIIEREKYRYQAALSDLSGNDIRSHSDSPEELVRQVRNWIVENVSPRARSGTQVWGAYNEFMERFETETTHLGFAERDLREMPIAEYIGFIYLLVSDLPTEIQSEPTSSPVSGRET
jgi:hypothetical protein